ncbi:MAG: hypothetical protein QM791_02900 [Ferruginibacter sp.]
MKVIALLICFNLYILLHANGQNPTQKGNHNTQKNYFPTKIKKDTVPIKSTVISGNNNNVVIGTNNGIVGDVVVGNGNKLLNPVNMEYIYSYVDSITVADTLKKSIDLYVLPYSNAKHLEAQIYEYFIQKGYSVASGMMATEARIENIKIWYKKNKKAPLNRIRILIGRFKE